MQRPASPLARAPWPVAFLLGGALLLLVAIGAFGVAVAGARDRPEA